MNTGPAGERALTVEVDPPHLSLDPGGMSSVSVSVSSDVDESHTVSVDIVGDAAPWFTVETSNVDLVRSGREIIMLSVRVPDNPGGHTSDVVVGVRARTSASMVRPHVAELRLSVDIPVSVQLDLVPAIRRSSRKGRYDLVVRNEAPSPVTVQLDEGDSDLETNVTVRPDAVTVPARGRARAKVAVTGRAPWGGPEPDWRFVVRGIVGKVHVEAPGVFVQRTKLGTASLLLAGLMTVVAVGLAILALQ